MNQSLWSRTAPWLGLAGAVVLITALMLAPGVEVPPESTDRVVQVSRRQIDDAVAAILSENPSLKDEVERLTEESREGAIAQSLFVAEAFDQGLAESDYVIRNRLVEMQVMALYERADAQVSAAAAREFYDENGDRYRTRPRRRCLHLFVPVTNLVDADEARRRLEAIFAEVDDWGEPRWVTVDDVRKEYGPTLAERVFAEPLNQWSEPIRSSLGWHYLMALEDDPSRALRFEEVRSRATEDCRRALRMKTYQAEVERLKAKYEVEEVE